MTVNYFDQEGVLINSDYKRYNIRSNTNFKRGNGILMQILQCK